MFFHFGDAGEGRCDERGAVFEGGFGGDGGGMAGCEGEVVD